MATIAVQPIVLTDVLLTVGTDTYEAHVSGVTFTPTSPTVTWKGLTPTSVHTFGGTATWTVTLNYAQDWETANSLSIYLMENEGETVSMTFEPKSGGASFTANVILTPGGIGGDVDTVAVSSVTLGVSGKPVRTPAV
jgi:hypothetical protein